jgi:hypothetical protein
MQVMLNIFVHTTISILSLCPVSFVRKENPEIHSCIHRSNHGREKGFRLASINSYFTFPKCLVIELIFYQKVIIWFKYIVF